MDTETAPQFCSIVPPQILHRLARSSDERVAQAAHRTLTVRSTIIGKREVRARAPRPGGPTAGGLIPPSLQERTRRPSARPDAQPALPTEQTSPHRTVYDAQRKTQLPGVLARGEGDPASADESVNEAYDGLGATWALLHESFGRDSLDDNGLALIASVHYDQDFDNAYWDGEQMVFGDGDGVYFSSFTDSVDVIGHELAHGLIQYTAGLVYVGQSGALNESVSDVIGAMVKQRQLKQTAAQADWLIGEGLFTDRVQGVALRSMKAPGTAYDDPHLGKDPQPATMDDYRHLPHDDSGDNGGVHINSGIPNHAFYLAATAIGGHSWESIGPIWYDTITVGRLPKDADFAAFAAATLRAAGTRYGVRSAQQQAVEEAWKTVKVL
ncbi:M4 family metallopeptidase [Yimella sp. cx-51]|uniref:M4 family metallopeptidase n=1 Tax=Yimella sp. cx-51 TaxID=2770551 RepID=UPI00165EBAFC|nr:M4 family metallopeptidase [Yimella sp. cx-51]MBC9956905.1 M4 family metallopeptidase [Yimella sp. cx-51]